VVVDSGSIARLRTSADLGRVTEEAQALDELAARFRAALVPESEDSAAPIGKVLA
jgi:hypothetical protein